MIKLLIKILLVIVTYNGFSQTVTITDVPVIINNGTTISVNGGITSSGSTAITNNGTISLTGDFINNTNSNLFGASAGTVTLNGSVQNIGGTSSTSFNNLILSGSGNKFLLTDILTGGTYTNSAGILQLNDKTLFLNSRLLTLSNGSPGALTQTTGFIQSETPFTPGYGRIKWIIGEATQGTNYTFPFGTSFGPSLIPFQLNITNPGSGVNGNFTISTYPTNSSNTPLPNGVSSVINFNGQNNSDFVLDRFWIIEPADYISLPVSDLTFTYRDIEHTQPTNTITESLLQMQFNNGTVWSPTPTGTVNTIVNTILVNNVSNYAFAWTAVDNSSPLPIELLFFTAISEDNNKVLCKWSTATEINNNYFIVQRSVNAVDFEDIGTVYGAGNSTSIIDYHLYDNLPYKGISYYRLRQVDYDGHFSYSATVPVNIDKNTNSDISIYPNPTRNTIFINSTQIIGNVEVIDITGRIIYINDYPENSTSINLEFTSPGIYYIKIKDQYHKLIKQ